MEWHRLAVDASDTRGGGGGGNGGKLSTFLHGPRFGSRARLVVSSMENGRNGRRHRAKPVRYAIANLTSETESEVAAAEDACAASEAREDSTKSAPIDRLLDKISSAAARFCPRICAASLRTASSRWLAATYSLEAMETLAATFDVSSRAGTTEAERIARLSEMGCDMLAKLEGALRLFWSQVDISSFGLGGMRCALLTGLQGAAKGEMQGTGSNILLLPLAHAGSLAHLKRILDALSPPIPARHG